ncbi:MAG: 50S ribosomal protein L9 [Candidatus Omnitrophota bacterium]
MNDNLENLGQLGEIVEVKPGYARNYLLPRSLALHPTAHNLHVMKYKKVKAQKKLEMEKLSAEEQKQKLEALTLTIARKAGESDTLFGSVTTIDIQAKLEEMGFNVERKKFHLDEPIKKLGQHLCKIRLMEGIEATLKIDVIKEGGDTEDKQ